MWRFHKKAFVNLTIYNMDHDGRGSGIGRGTGVVACVISEKMNKTRLVYNCFMIDAILLKIASNMISFSCMFFLTPPTFPKGFGAQVRVRPT